jgi:maleate isomerase
MTTWMKDLGKYNMWVSNNGWRARVGAIHPGAGFPHLADFYKLAPKGVGLGSTGIPFHKDESGETMMHLDDHVVEAAQLLAGTKPEPDAIAWICTAGSFMKGKGHDERLIKEMEAATGTPCTTCSTAVMTAFRQLGIKKLCLATPYPLDVNEIEKKFFEDNGFKVLKSDGLDLVDNNILANLPSSVLYRLAKQIDVPEADGIFISCTGLDTLDIIDALERDLGKPVVTSNQASFWHLFKLAKVGEPIQGFGRLFAEPRWQSDSHSRTVSRGM